MTKPVPLLALLATCIAVSPTPTFANPFETKLANGLRVIVKEDRRAPTAVHMVWYRAGAMDEKDGTSGVAHVLEHMMFKGTKHYAAGEFNKIVAEAGGRDNAFTSLDYTAYFQIVPKRALPRMMELEADRMANLQLTAKEFEQEIKVVMEERRMRTEDNPQSLVHEALYAAAFKAHPYRRPIIGWMDDLEHMSYTDARDWYHAWYTPSNAYVVVVGDVDHQAVFDLAAKTYGRIKPHALPERKPQNEPEQPGIKRVTVKAPAKLPYLAMAWKVPKLKDVDADREPYALEVLATVLDGHDAARFSKNLVRGSKIAQSAGAGYDGTLRGEAMFILDGQPAEGRTVAELEAALRAELKRVQDEGVSPEELARVKTQTIASQVYKRDSMMAQAMEIGGIEAAGHKWQDIDKLLEKIRGVTAEEVLVVARKYFNDDALTVAVLDPLPLDQAKPRKPAVAVRH
ncbi:M16 family metallopeptidase [Sulfurisoma sediminicola]|uniref:Zinc protease n=1 Tax=Sulfurisoma sediminicola TaxID=1381557 RepID=A0A497XP60_9PROT|nr:pitrilysin family protein [Sulfurisoma sediminicola]RLJ67959.1 zinc protease [Sulfurisoma sediminicola]